MNAQYYYHGTTVDRLPLIKEHGLIPAAEHGLPVSFPRNTDPHYIYFTDNYANAAEWSKEARNHDVSRYIPVLIRFPKKALGNMVECDPNFASNFDEPCDELRSSYFVPSDEIQVAGAVIDTDNPYLKYRYHLSNEWIPLSEYVPETARAFTVLGKEVHRKPSFKPVYRAPMGVVYGSEPAIQRASKMLERLKKGDYA